MTKPRRPDGKPRIPVAEDSRSRSEQLRAVLEEAVHFVQVAGDDKQDLAVPRAEAMSAHRCGYSAHSGGLEQRLSPRQTEVLRWIAAGKTDWAIGMILNISERAVKFHAAGGRQKLQATNRAHAIAIAVSSGVIDLS